MSYYIIIPHQVYSHKDLNPGSKFLYGLILSLSQKDGYCYASNKYMSNALDVSPRTLQNYLSDLSTHDLIHIQVLNGNSRVITTFDTHRSIKKPLTAKKQPLNAREPEWMAEYIADLANYSGN